MMNYMKIYMRNIALECAEQVHELCPEDTFKRLLWDQQQRSSSVRNSKSMRWHPIFIKWFDICLDQHMIFKRIRLCGSTI